MTKYFLFSSEPMFYPCIVAIILIYCSSIFSISQFIKFIKCIDINFKNPFFEARHSKVNLFHISLFLFVLYILNPVSLILLICNINKSVPIFINNIANNLIFISFFIRSYVFCFDRYFVCILRNWIWRKEINHRECETNLLLKYRKFLSSNGRLVISVFFIVFISPIYIILLMLSFRVMYTIMLIILLIATYYLIYKMSPVSDEYYVGRELVFSIQTTGLLYVSSHIIYLIFSFYNSEKVAIFAQIFSLSLANLCFIYFSCYWARSKFIFKSIQKLKTSTKTNIQFADIMNHRAGIEALCHHLVNVFCLESICFIIEVCQFKAKMHKQHKNILSDIVRMHGSNNYNIIFSASKILNVNWMPINERMNVHSPYKIALYLYDKYIETSANLCINISWTNRHNINRMFKHLSAKLRLGIHGHDALDIDDVTMLYALFDAAYNETLNLIEADPFARFTSTKQFQRLIHVLHPAKCKKMEEMSESKFSLKIKSHQLDKVAVSSVSPTSPKQQEKKRARDSRHVRPDSVPSLPSAALFNHLAICMTVKTQRHSMNTHITNDRYHILNEIVHVVPSDILKTAADFWRHNINPLSNSETLEIGLTIYFSMFACDPSMRRLFKKHSGGIKTRKIEIISLKFLYMIGWLIQLLWDRDTQQLYPALAKLGKVHKNLKLTINHFNVMLSVLHETLKFYFPVKYRLQEQYCFDYIFAYSSEVMMSTKTKSKTYFKTLELKFNSEKLNDSIKHNNNQSKPIPKSILKPSLPKLTNDPDLLTYSYTNQHTAK